MNTRWFLNMQGEIRGPVPAMNIVKSLLAGEFTVVQRVSRDGVNWVAVCNEPHFETIIKGLIDDLTNGAEAKEATAITPLGDENTNTGFSNLDSIRAGISEQLAKAQKLTEVNFNTGALRTLLSSIEAKKKLVIEEAPPAETVQPEEMFVHKVNPKREAERKKRHFQLLFKIFIYLGALGGIVVSIDAFLKYRDRSQVELNEKLKAQALQAKALGEYDRALNLFRGIDKPELLDPKTLLAMAEASVGAKRYPEGHSLVSQVLSRSKDAGDRAKALSLSGVMAMNEGDLSQAEAELEKSIKEGELYPALHNMGILFLDRGEAEKAEPFLLKALTTGSDDKALTLLALFEVSRTLEEPGAAAAKNPEPPATDRRSKVDTMLEEYAAKSDNFSNEILLSRIVLNLSLKRPELAEPLIAHFIDRDPGVPLKRDASFELSRSRITDDRVLRWCSDAYTRERTKPWLNALIARCLLKPSGPAKSLPYATFASHSLPAAAEPRGLAAYILLKLSRAPEAHDLLRGSEADPKKLSRLALMTLIEVCIKEADSKGAKRYSEMLEGRSKGR
jgi:tetratricopeptide (TPR) repeat protein